MAIEIERKFLVCSDAYRALASDKRRIVQAYLNSDKQRTVRVRIDGDKAYLTVKGCSDTQGLSRFEWEQAISVQDAQALLPLCEPGSIDKVRYIVPCGELYFEVDEFAGDNHGLVVAEIELAHVEQTFTRPAWLGEEVTGNNAYYNSALSRYPYKSWSQS